MGKYDLAIRTIFNSFKSKTGKILSKTNTIVTKPSTNNTKEILRFSNNLTGDTVSFSGTAKNITNIETPAITKIDTTKAITSTQSKITTPIITDLEHLQLNNGVKIPVLDRNNINPESLCLVHADKYDPVGNRILSAREALTVDGVGASRNSVHFTLNHPVAAHWGGEWDNSPLMILMPYNATKVANPTGKFIEGFPNDLYTNGSVIIPKGSVIIKKNPAIQTGKLKISEHPEIDGVKLIETSENPHKLSIPVMEKMGYTHATANNDMGVFDLGVQKTSKKQYVQDITDNFQYWMDFCKKEGIKPIRHSGSLNGQAETIIECLDMLATTNSWKISSTNYKKIILENIKFINQNAEKYGYFLSMDTNKLAQIVKKSLTPEIALKKIQNELQLKPILHRPRKFLSRYNDYACSIDIRLNHLDDFQKDIDLYFNKLSNERKKIVITKNLSFDLSHIKD